MKRPRSALILLRHMLCIASLIVCLPSFTFAVLDNYCQIPPYIVAGATPNLLLMLDNSASMYDLAYVDEGRKDANGNVIRKPAYCYDQTYQSSKEYFGYFYKDAAYQYNFGTQKFDLTASVPSGCDKPILGTLCINHDGATVTDFFAKGNYLNWLTSSKLDIQKDILTGGKYDTTNSVLIGESRGCVGRRFVKEALTADYVEGGLNTSLKITFAVRGPENTANPTALSPGGQTEIDIYLGDYNEGLCQAAIDAITAGHDPASIKQTVDDCLSATTSPSAYCSFHPATGCTKRTDCPDWKSGEMCITPTATTEAKQKVVFGQTIQACWAYGRGTPISVDEVNTVKNQCTDLYDENRICIGGARDGKVCSGNPDCPGGACTNGPTAIQPGNPSYLCSSAYVGYCASTSNGWVTTTWEKREFNSDNACITRKHEEFCTNLQVPPVVDPTDEPSDTQTYDNLPAIISDVGIEAQLNQPIKTLSVKTAYRKHCSQKWETECTVDSNCLTGERCLVLPEGVLQEFRTRIRFGLMEFNPNGSSTECGIVGSRVSCPKVCSNDASKYCTTALDCGGSACVSTVQNVTNLDGSRIKLNIGDPVGDHNTAGTLVKVIDDITAKTWTPFAEGFKNAVGYFARTNAYTDSNGDQIPGISRTDLRINTADYNENKNPSQFPCQRNNLLLITDGMSTTDLNTGVNTLVGQFNDGDGQTDSAMGVCPKYAGSRNLDDLAWLARNRNISDFNQALTSTDRDNPSNQSKYIKTYVVYTGTTNNEAGECNSETLMQQTATNGCGNANAPCYQRPEDYRALRKAISKVLLDLAVPASGTASSVLASSQGSGANLLQALFYPSDKRFDPQEITWSGEMQNLWYFLDPELQSETIREDTNENRALELSNDRIVKFFFDSERTRTRVKRCADFACATPVDTIELEEVHDLWKAGEKLWAMTPGERKIYTNDGTAWTGQNFTTSNKGALRPLLQAADDNEAEALIRYIRGEDTPFIPPISGFIPSYRSRTLIINGTSNVWKLGDIVSSTPKQQSSIPLNSYHLDPPSGYSDKTYAAFINDTAYKNRGMVYTGANDGMLHAFKFGTLEQVIDSADSNLKARLTDADPSSLGKEEWAFIPKNALPYLKALSDPFYCHLYYVDTPPYIFDASTGGAADSDKTASSWRTIVIAGMGLGGACKNAGAACGTDTNGDGVTDDKDCVRTPVDGVGYSSYFAIDVTNPKSPEFLWEFSDPNLGFSTSGPAVVRTGNRDKNGEWHVVFGSGPTGPIDNDKYQFMGASDQNFRLFVLDLRTGALKKTIDTGIQQAFSGSLVNSPIDTDRPNSGSVGFYSDDAFYVGYAKKSGTAWDQGGVLRVITKDAGPDEWAASKVTDDIGPVTAAVAKLQDLKNKTLWLYFGTGRYFFKNDKTVDDPDNRRKLFGVKEPCYDPGAADIDVACTSQSGGVLDQTSSPVTTLPAGKDGWSIDLDDAAGIFKAERVLTDPLAAFNGAVFFVTVSPSSDVCGFGGHTFLWAVRYDTGSKPFAAALQGSALIQVSTGSIEQIKLAEAFTDKDERRTPSGVFGVPPKGQGLTVIINPKPIRKILHTQEK